MNTAVLPAEGLILCAVSGGIDSMYLLCRLTELGYPVAAAHYNHGLRGEAADRDEAFVRGFCAERGVPFRSARGDVPAYAREHGLGIEDAARRLRYDFLERTAQELGAAVIATAHTADDNAETVLLRLARGTGLRGLGGIPPVRGRIVRPMLDTTRSEAEAWLAERGLPHIEDETNAEDGAARNRVRHHVIPALKAENPAFPAAVGRMTALLREDEAFLDGIAEHFVERRAMGLSLPAEPLAALPRPVARRVIRRMAGTSLGAEHVETLLRLAERGGCADVPGLRAAVSGGRIWFGVRDARPLPDRALTPGRTVYLPEAGLTVRCSEVQDIPDDVYKSFNTFYFNCEKICGNMTVGARRPGDKYRPARRRCTKSLKRLFEEAGVPAWERDAVPVLRDKAGILALLGAGPAERAAAKRGDRRVMKIEFLRDAPEEGGDTVCTTILK